MRLVRSNITVEQAQLPVTTDSMDVQTVSSRSVTYQSGVYPTSNCIFSGKNVRNNGSVVHFLLSPFIYNTDEKKLYFVDTFKLTIKTTDDFALSEFPEYTIDPDMLKDFLINPDELSSIESDIPVLGERIDYIVLTNNKLKNAFSPLVSWKKKKGIYTKIVTIEEIESLYEGSDTPLKIKKYLDYRYRNNGLRYVLLGGDDSIVPARMCYSECGDRSCQMPSDMYYGCFNGNFEWDANGNGIYGENNDDIDFMPSIYVTRVPVRQPSHVTAFVNKLLEYERNPKWNNRILTAGIKLFTYGENGNSDGKIKGDIIYDNYINPQWNGTRFSFYDTYTDNPAGASYDVTAENVAKELSNGYAFMQMNTHGGQTSWTTERGPYYRSSDGLLQDNIGQTVITTIACHTNAFDAPESDTGTNPCLSESLIRNPDSGVVGYLGCSREGWGKFKLNDLGASMKYEATFYKNLFASEDTHFGEVTSKAKVDNIAVSQVDKAYRWVQLGLNPIGDPEMPLFIDTPKEFGSIDISKTGNAVMIDTGVSDCRICVMSSSDSGKKYYKVYDNIRTISLSDLPTRCSICVCKPGYIPKCISLCILQNQTLTTSQTYDYDVVLVGSSVTTARTEGPVVIQSGRTEIKSSKAYVEPTTIVKKGASFIITNKKD